MKLLLLIVTIIVYTVNVSGQDKCSSLGQFKPITIECPHKPKNCPEYVCTHECDPICVYLKKQNSFEKFKNKCYFCQSDRCNRSGAFQVPLSFCRRQHGQLKMDMPVDEMETQ